MSKPAMEHNKPSSTNTVTCASENGSFLVGESENNSGQQQAKDRNGSKKSLDSYRSLLIGSSAIGSHTDNDTEANSPIASVFGSCETVAGSNIQIHPDAVKLYIKGVRRRARLFRRDFKEKLLAIEKEKNGNGNEEEKRVDGNSVDKLLEIKQENENYGISENTCIAVTVVENEVAVAEKEDNLQESNNCLRSKEDPGVSTTEMREEVTYNSRSIKTE